MPSLLSQLLAKRRKSTSALRANSQPIISHYAQDVVPTSETAPEPRRSGRARRPSAHKRESDAYAASSRGSSRPSSPSESAPKEHKSRKLPWGKRGERPGHIASQPGADSGSSCDEGTPGPLASAGPKPSDSRLASRGMKGKAAKAADRTEIIRRASSVLGFDASRYTTSTLEAILASVPDNGKEAGASAMEIAGGSAPPLAQSAGRVGLACGHQPPAATALDAPADNNSATEDEDEPEFIELRPDDSMSQRSPRPSPPHQTPRLSDHPAPPAPSVPPNLSAPPALSRLSRASDILNEASIALAAAEAEDPEAEDPEASGPGSDSEFEKAPAPKRPRLDSPTSHNPHAPLPSAPFHSTHSRRTSSCGEMPLMPIFTLNPQATPRTRVSTASTSNNLFEPPATSDIRSVLSWAVRAAKHASAATPGSSSSRQASQPDALYGVLAEVLGNLDLRLAGSEPTLQFGASRPPFHPRHMEFVEDDAELLEAEAALRLGRHHLNATGKPTLSDFPGLPRRIASLAIPDLIVTACTQGAYEVFGTVSDWATSCFNQAWRHDLPDEPLIKLPRQLNSLMVRRVSWFRGECKKRGRPEVPYEYPFINPARTLEAIEYNRQLALELLPDRFYYRDPKTKTDPYEHPAIPQFIAAIFFWGADSLGLVYRDKFNPIPIPAVAMTLTIMQHCIGEWKTGRRVEIALNAGTESRIYDAHLKGLLEYAKPAPGRLRDFRSEWFKYCVDYASERHEDDDAPVQPITQADRVRPDSPHRSASRHAKGKGRAEH
ncbi:hypothetical protein FRC12_003314 [Ceratobasidium sp. 428]|nr:hypothetical protein FRC12_003314 [Ceratobasidium sp. 428]